MNLVILTSLSALALISSYSSPWFLAKAALTVFLGSDQAHFYFVALCPTKSCPLISHPRRHSLFLANVPCTEEADSSRVLLLKLQVKFMLYCSSPTLFHYWLRRWNWVISSKRSCRSSSQKLDRRWPSRSRNKVYKLVEDQASAARPVFKEAQGCGSILAIKNWSGCFDTIQRFWMRGGLLKKGLGVVCSEDEKNSRLTPEKEAEAFDLLLSIMSESSLSRVMTTTSARIVEFTLRKLYENVQVLHLHMKTKFSSSDTRMWLLLKIASTV